MASSCSTPKPYIMAHEEKKQKNIKKVATKPAKVHGAPKIPKYEQNESGIIAPIKKGK